MSMNWEGLQWIFIGVLFFYCVALSIGHGSILRLLTVIVDQVRILKRDYPPLMEEEDEP